MIITLKNGERIEDELARANAHPAGARPFKRNNYVHKFDTLIENRVSKQERDRFLGLADRLATLSADEIKQLNVVQDLLVVAQSEKKGLFE